MKAIAFADSKFMDIAKIQTQNFAEFGVEHIIVNIPDQTYGIDLWIYLLDKTIDCIHEHGKIFRVDSEIRLLKPLPESWYMKSNVLFFIEPIITIPWFTPINTGHMILSQDAIPFLSLLKELTLACIPPGYDGYKLNFDDEDMVAPALRLSKLDYHREVIDYYRNDASTAACTRGDWFTEHTIFTHGFMHNWNTGTHNIFAYDFLRNNFAPGVSSKNVDAIIFGLSKRIIAKSFWTKLGFDEDYQQKGWFIEPNRGAFWHRDYPTPKFIEQK